MAKREFPSSKQFCRFEVRETNSLQAGAPLGPPNGGSRPDMLANALEEVKRAFSKREWVVLEEVTDEAGNWTVEFHRNHPNNRSRRTFFVS